MKNLAIGARLYLLVGFMALGLFTVGILGLYGAHVAEVELQSIYEQRVVPLRELATIRRLHAENIGHVFRALQHNPDYPYSKLHDHPTTEHTGAVDRNLKAMEEGWARYRKVAARDGEEDRIADQFEALFAEHRREVLAPMLAALQGADFSFEQVRRFLAANRKLDATMTSALEGLTEIQQTSVKADYQRAASRNATLRGISLAVVLLALAVGTWLAVTIIRSITRPMAEMQDIIERAAEHHDYTGRIGVAGGDEVSRAAKAFNHLMDSVTATIGHFRSHSGQLDQEAQQLAATADQLAAGAADTSNSTASMAGSVEQLVASIGRVSENASAALSLSRESGETAVTGGRVIRDTSAEMSRMAASVEAASASIDALGQQTGQISSIVQVIHEVADQTNLLALNAAIEAARAGESGRGFAVVADEVRKLAERTSNATSEITAMIAAIQASASSAVTTMRETVASVSDGVELANQASSAVTSIRDTTDQVAGVVATISATLTEQHSASSEISGQVERVAQASEQAHAASASAAASAGLLRQLAADMNAMVQRFRLA